MVLNTIVPYPAQSTPIGFRPCDPGSCGSPGTGSTCTKTGQLALSIMPIKPVTIMAQLLRNRKSDFAVKFDSDP